MRLPAFAISISFLMVGLTMTSAGAGDDKKAIKPTQKWGGIVSEQGKLEAAPKSGHLTNQDAFDKLWDKWGLKDKAPKIDFAKQLVFVQIASGPNLMSTSYTLDGKGNLTVISAQTQKAGPGFGYGIHVLDREGIKTYNGKPLDK